MLSKKIYVFTFLILTLFFISSCNQDTKNFEDVDFEIVSPRSSWTYYSDEQIVFRTNLSNNSLIWNSDIDGQIGKGANVFAFLNEGKHRISLTDTQNGTSKSIDISILRRYVSSSVQKRMLVNLPCSLMIPEDRNEKLGIVSLNGAIRNLSIKTEEKNNSKCLIGDATVNSIFSPEDVFEDVLTHDITGLNPVVDKRSIGCKALYDFRSTYNLGDTKNFYVENTVNTYYDPHEILADFVTETDNLNFWIEHGISSDDGYIQKCIYDISSVIVPRLNTLWGKCADINKDGGVTVLFVSTLNEEKIALGFFNPLDFFKRNTCKTDSDYNPYSNECDIIYVAIPETDDISMTFNVNAIIATLAHELSHAINFTNKTYSRLLAGNSDAGQMDVFLDEGLSHLTESLIGYGKSGGNAKFIDKYLKNSSYYSLCASDAGGNEDSMGRRGGMSLFLYWLFQKYGGMTYATDGKNFVDNGGISFLRNIIENSEIGWEAIGEATKSFGKHVSTDSLFMEFAEDMISKSYSSVFDIDIKDPVTMENIIPDNEFVALDIETKCNIVSYSVLKLNTDSQIENILFDADGLNGTVFFTY